MRMAKAFIAAVPLALALVAALVVPLALTPGTFGFHSWPASPLAPPRDNAVVLEQPLVLLGRARSVVAVRPVVRDAVEPRQTSRQRAPIARVDAVAPRLAKVTSPRSGGDRAGGGDAAGPRTASPARPDPAGATNQTPSGPQAAPEPAAPAPDPAGGPGLVAQQPDPAPDPAPTADARPVAPPSGDHGGGDDGDVTDLPRVVLGAVTGHGGDGNCRGRSAGWVPPGQRDDRN